MAHLTPGLNRRPFLDIRDFGAVCNGADDDSSAIAAAIAALPTIVEARSGDILIPGPTRINSTVALTQFAGRLFTPGSGYGDASGGALIWGGAADEPMIRMTRSYGAVLEVRLVGNGTNQPSAGIELAAPGSSTPDNQSITIRNTAIGPDPLRGGSSPELLKRGVHILGATGNDRLIMDNVEIIRPSVSGITSENYNSIWNQWDSVLIDGQGTYVPHAIQSAGGFTATNLNMNWCTIGIDTATGNAGPEVQLVGMGNEKVKQLFKAGIDTHLMVLGGRSYVGTADADSDVIDFLGMGFSGSIHMIGHHFAGMNEVFGNTGRPKVRLVATRVGAHAEFKQCRGLRHTDIAAEVGPIGSISLEATWNSSPLDLAYTGGVSRQVLTQASPDPVLL